MSDHTLQLTIRTPEGILYDQRVQAISAEDDAGWFGILPGREDIIACLPPGLLTFRDDTGENFVALSSGLLELRGSACRVMARDARMSRALDQVADALQRVFEIRRTRSKRSSGVLEELEREALRRLAAERRS